MASLRSNSSKSARKVRFLRTVSFISMTCWTFESEIHYGDTQDCCSTESSAGTVRGFGDQMGFIQSLTREAELERQSFLWSVNTDQRFTPENPRLLCLICLVPRNILKINNILDSSFETLKIRISCTWQFMVKLFESIQRSFFSLFYNVLKSCLSSFL